MIPADWSIERADKAPFKYIAIKAPNGYRAHVDSLARNPENILYMLAEAMLEATMPFKATLTTLIKEANRIEIDGMELLYHDTDSYDFQFDGKLFVSDGDPDYPEELYAVMSQEIEVDDNGTATIQVQDLDGKEPQGDEPGPTKNARIECFMMRPMVASDLAAPGVALPRAFGGWDRAEIEKLCVALDAIGTPNGNKAAVVAASKFRKMLDTDGVPASDQPERLEPHSPPGLHLASNFYGFLRRHAHSLKDPTRGAVEQAAELIDLQRREIERLGRELDAASGVTVVGGGTKA